MTIRVIYNNKYRSDKMKKEKKNNGREINSDKYLHFIRLRNKFIQPSIFATSLEEKESDELINSRQKNTLRHKHNRIKSSSCRKRVVLLNQGLNSRELKEFMATLGRYNICAAHIPSRTQTWLDFPLSDSLGKNLPLYGNLLFLSESPNAAQNCTSGAAPIELLLDKLVNHQIMLDILRQGRDSVREQSLDILREDWKVQETISAKLDTNEEKNIKNIDYTFADIPFDFLSSNSLLLHKDSNHVGDIVNSLSLAWDGPNHEHNAIKMLLSYIKHGKLTYAGYSIFEKENNKEVMRMFLDNTDLYSDIFVSSNNSRNTLLSLKYFKISAIDSFFKTHRNFLLWL